MSFIYSALLSSNSLILQNVGGVIFCVFLLLMVLLFLKNSNSNSTYKFIFILYLSITFGVVFFSSFLGVSEHFFWVPDSIATHLPESLKIKQYLSGDSDFHFNDFFSKSGRFTHSLTGLALLVFGDNYFATGVAQILFKIVTLIVIFKAARILFDFKVATSATALYAFTPTVFFYTNVLYKESAVHMLVAFSFYYLLKINLKINLLNVVLFSITLVSLYIERSYLVPLFFLTFLGLLFLKISKNKNSLWFFLFFSILSYTALYIFFPQFLSTVWSNVESLRKFHASFEDIANQINYHIPYPVAFIKTLFSPYFTLNKFTIFVGFSNLLIWGSFSNQLIILFSTIGFILNLKKSILHLYIWLPFIIFLLFAAYISPWSGRIRDSFYPILVCYAAYYINSNDKIQNFLNRLSILTSQFSLNRFINNFLKKIVVIFIRENRF